MAKKKTEDNILIDTAKVVGAVAGKIASVLGVAPEKRSATTNKGKLQKKNKSRVPRRQKKLQQKAAARKSAHANPTL